MGAAGWKKWRVPGPLNPAPNKREQLLAQHLPSLACYKRTMSRRQHFIPSQRLPVSVASATTEAKPHRSLLWAVGITLLGWLVLAYPAVLLALLSYLYMAGTGASPEIGRAHV